MARAAEAAAVRCLDRLRGVGWGDVRNGELFVIPYTAPRLVFFARHPASAEAIAKSACVHG